MFIRNERSLKEFIQFYPIVSSLVIIHLFLWLIINFLQLPFGLELYQWGVGINLLTHNGEYWRLITSIFLHGDLMHALFNSFALVLFGPALEQMLGRFKFIIAYFGAGIAGNIATYAFEPTAFYMHLGASGAIFGLFGIYVFMIAFRKSLIDQANSQIVMTIFIIGLIMTFLRSNINISAHIFGFFGGFIIAPLVLSNVRPFSPWRNRRYRDDDSIQFDPNRWKKRRIPSKLKKNIFWIILGILVVLGLLSRF
ncbi:rhomboid family intramembrane serine protease [Virgibacillus profundi]|uniref:Rhomboid family intramembrane serine protease n=1 Tax=Virgibacillus profundi TaxID=2024555 RepID=A0A2A2IGC6_9BACI|nr:rhomboid family intramembrane serine protease [Virgibacillus profundi]PAV30707.1 rhomboid family intramembrane serine protease [Virgibacillus profundi]PXY54879.1 rhomboid family intramembrane serine protease [Virgibacillus profundi]